MVIFLSRRGDTKRVFSARDEELEAGGIGDSPQMPLRATAEEGGCECSSASS